MFTRAASRPLAVIEIHQRGKQNNIFTDSLLYNMIQIRGENKSLHYKPHYKPQPSKSKIFLFKCRVETGETDKSKVSHQSETLGYVFCTNVMPFQI